MEKRHDQSRFRNVAGRETESQHEINVDTCIPATLLKHAKARKRNIHEVPKDDNSLFSALANQLTDATFTGQSLRDHIETFIFGRWRSEQYESFLLSNPNSRQDTRPTIQDASDFLRHNIVLYRDDDNPPYLIQPNVDGPDPICQGLHIGCINNKYYVSFQPHGYNQGHGASVPGRTDSDEDRSDDDSENVNSYRVKDNRSIINIGDNNQTTFIADVERSISVKSISYGNNNHVALKIIVPKKDNTYVERMIDSGSCVGDKGICLKINISGMSQSEIERAERSVIEHKIKIQDDINAKIRSDGVELSILRLGCLLMCFRPNSWLNCRAFIMGLSLHSEKYLDIFRQLLKTFQHINDSNNLTLDVKISIDQLSEGIMLSDSISGTEFKDIFDLQARNMDTNPQPDEKKDIRKKQTTTDPRSGRSVVKDDTLSLQLAVRPVGEKSFLSSTDLEKVAVRTTEQVLEFEEADVSYIPHAKTHDQMTTIHSKPGDRPRFQKSKTSIDFWSDSKIGGRRHRARPRLWKPKRPIDFSSETSIDFSSDSKIGGRRHLAGPRFWKSKRSIDFSSDLKPGDRRHLDRRRFWKSISEKVTKLFTGPSKDADSVPPDGLGQYSVRSKSSGYSSGSERTFRSVSDRPSYGDSDSDAASDAESDVNSGSPLSDADKQLRSLLTKNLSDAVRREFARSKRPSINDPDIDGALNTIKWNVFVISSGDKQLGTAFSLGKKYMLTAGHVLGGSKAEYLLVRNELLSGETTRIGISPIADVGVLRTSPAFYDKMPILDIPVIDFGTEFCTYIYVVGYVDGNMSLQGEKCPVLPPQDKDDGYIRFQSKRFHQGSSGSPCLVFKNGKFVLEGILVGREKGTDMPHELIAITFSCLWKRLGLPLVF